MTYVEVVDLIYDTTDVTVFTLQKWSKNIFSICIEILKTNDFLIKIFLKLQRPFMLQYELVINLILKNLP